MGPTADLTDAAAPIDRVVARIGVGPRRPAKIPREGLGRIPLVRGRRVEDDLPTERIEVGPQAPGETAAVIPEHRHRGVVGVESRSPRGTCPWPVAARALRRPRHDSGDRRTSAGRSRRSENSRVGTRASRRSTRPCTISCGHTRRSCRRPRRRPRPVPAAGGPGVGDAPSGAAAQGHARASRPSPSRSVP